MLNALAVVGIVLGAVLLALALALTIFIALFRRQNPGAVDALRRLSRAVGRSQRETAGRVGAGASLIHHVGRRSGAAHVTPIGATPVEGGFEIALPYGRTADWLRNVLAAGGGRLDHEGESFEVTDPEVVPIATTVYAHEFPIRLLKIREGLRLRVRG